MKGGHGHSHSPAPAKPDDKVIHTISRIFSLIAMVFKKYIIFFETLPGYLSYILQVWRQFAVVTNPIQSLNLIFVELTIFFHIKSDY